MFKANMALETVKCNEVMGNCDIILNSSAIFALNMHYSSHLITFYLSVAGPTVAQLKVFISSDHL